MQSAPGEKPLGGPARITALLALTVLSLVSLGVLLVLLLTQKHYVGSRAMEPSLLMGDFVAFAPGYLAGDPKAGDVFTFEVETSDYTSLYVMRVIGLPGDRISLANGVVSINGQALPRKDLGPAASADTTPGTHKWEETLPDGRSYLVLDDPGEGGLDDMTEVTVPPGHYFVLGDNRDNANDSRARPGMIARDAFAGRALMIYFATSKDGIDFTRMGTRVR